MVLFVAILKGLAYLSIVFAVYCVTEIILIVIRNKRAYKFFQKHAPNLPQLPNPHPITGHMMSIGLDKRIWKRFDENHKKYGTTVAGFMSNRPIISTIDLDFLKSVLLDSPYENINRIHISQVIDVLAKDSIAMAQDDQWKKIRKLTAPGFSAHKLKAPVVQEQIQGVIERFIHSLEYRIEMDKKMNLEENNDEKKRNLHSIINIDDLSHRFALDIVMTTYYKQPDIIDYLSDRCEWVEKVEEICESVMGIPSLVAISLPFLGKFFHWYLCRFHIQAKLRDSIYDLIRTTTKANFEAKKQLQLNGNKKDSTLGDTVNMSDGSLFIRSTADYMIDQYHAGKFTYSEYMNTAWIIFMAGNKTSADALSKIFYFLTIHPNVQQKLRESIFREGTESQYLNWVILESMRLFPPLVLGSLRTLSVDKVTSDGHLIPKGVGVITPAYTIHRLKEYWGEDAEEFNPERWSKSNTFHPCQYLAFGVGKRNCLGKELAMLELKKLIDAVLRRYKFEKTDQTPKEIDFLTPLSIAMIFVTPSIVKVSHLTPEDRQSLHSIPE